MANAWSHPLRLCHNTYQNSARVAICPLIFSSVTVHVSEAPAGECHVSRDSCTHHCSPVPRDAPTSPVAVADQGASKQKKPPATANTLVTYYPVQEPSVFCIYSHHDVIFLPSPCTYWVIAAGWCGDSDAQKSCLLLHTAAIDTSPLWTQLELSEPGGGVLLCGRAQLLPERPGRAGGGERLKGDVQFKQDGYKHRRLHHRGLGEREICRGWKPEAQNRTDALKMKPDSGSFES